MANKTNNDLILLDALRSKLLFPDTGTPLVERSLLIYLDQLQIKPVLLKVNEKGQPRRHITKAQAELVTDLFKAKHWRKFRAQKEKP